MCGLVFDDVGFGYGRGGEVVRVSGGVESGVLCVLGPNGSGKSTLLRGIVGAARMTRGDVLLDGVSLTRMSARTRAGRVSLVAQRGRVGAGYSVREVVALGRALVGACSSAVERAMDRVGLVDLADARADALSVGQLQRVLVARALAQLDLCGDGDGWEGGSRVLLADEPLSALDPRHVRGILGILGEVGRLAGVAVVVVLHDPAAAAAIASDVLLLGDGGEVGSVERASDGLACDRLASVYKTSFVVDGQGYPRAELPMGAADG